MPVVTEFGFATERKQAEVSVQSVYRGKALLAVIIRDTSGNFVGDLLINRSSFFVSLFCCFAL